MEYFKAERGTALRRCREFVTGGTRETKTGIVINLPMEVLRYGRNNKHTADDNAAKTDATRVTKPEQKILSNAEYREKGGEDRESVERKGMNFTP